MSRAVELMECLGNGLDFFFFFFAVWITAYTTHASSVLQQATVLAVLKRTELPPVQRREDSHRQFLNLITGCNANC